MIFMDCIRAFYLFIVVAVFLTTGVDSSRAATGDALGMGLATSDAAASSMAQRPAADLLEPIDSKFRAAPVPMLVSGNPTTPPPLVGTWGPMDVTSDENGVSTGITNSQNTNSCFTPGDISSIEITPKANGEYHGRELWKYVSTCANSGYFPAAYRVLEDQNGYQYLKRCAINYEGPQPTIAENGDFQPDGATCRNFYRSFPTGGQVSSVASLGDSYSSGEGLLAQNGASYDCGTDLISRNYYEDTTLGFGLPWVSGYHCDLRTGSKSKPSDLASRPQRVYRNLCHRTSLAYPNQIRERLGVNAVDALFAACSGATTFSITDVAQHPNSPFGVHGGQPQAQTLEDFSSTRTDDGDPDLITIGIGGNDAKFGEIIKQCMLRDCVADPLFAQGVVSTIQTDVYRRVRLVLRNIRESHPTSIVTAFGYPSIIGDPADSCIGVDIGPWEIDESERSWLKFSVIPLLNDSIRDAARAVGVKFIDITSATSGHEVCQADPWINGIRLGQGEDWSPIATESFHLNQYGHDAIASFFMSRFTSGTRLQFGNPFPAPTDHPEPLPLIKVGTVVASATRACGSDCLQPTACVQACSVTVTLNGFSPNTRLKVTLHSDPVDLGYVDTDEAGNASTEFTLPSGVNPGVHSIQISGAQGDVSQFGADFVEVFVTEPPPRFVVPEPDPEPDPLPPSEPPWTPSFPLPPLPPPQPPSSSGLNFTEIVVDSRTLKVSRRRETRIALRCPQWLTDCLGVLKLSAETKSKKRRASRITLGSKAYDVRKGQKVSLRLKVSRKAFALIRARSLTRGTITTVSNGVTRTQKVRMRVARN